MSHFALLPNNLRRLGNQHCVKLRKQIIETSAACPFQDLTDLRADWCVETLKETQDHIAEKMTSNCSDLRLCAPVRNAIRKHFHHVYGLFERRHQYRVGILEVFEEIFRFGAEMTTENYLDRERLLHDLFSKAKSIEIDIGSAMYAGPGLREYCLQLKRLTNEKLEMSFEIMDELFRQGGWPEALTSGS